MNIIKLNAIDSTNSYLKKCIVEKDLESYTVVLAEHQTKGRGQMGAVWESERGKNLTFSILVKFLNFEVHQQFYLSMAVALAVLRTVNTYLNTSIFVKWPNDILADKDKLAGILIENMLTGNQIKQAVIGIGLNVNQEKFSENVKNVTSLKKLTNLNFDKDKLLGEIVESLKYYINYIECKDFMRLKKLYLKKLYRFEIPTMFEDKSGYIFLGKIITVSEDGHLVIELENETTRKFNLKEIKFASC